MSQKPAAPPPPTASASNPRSPASLVPQIVPLNITTGPTAEPDRIFIYGTGGVGKTTLASSLPSPLFLDLNRGTRKLNVARDFASNWSEVRGKCAAIAASPPKGMESFVIDTATDAEMLATEHVIQHRRTEKGKPVDSINGFGWNRGWEFVYEEFLGLVADLDRINARGIIVCVIAHVVTSPVPNPSGEDYIRWEPSLYPGNKKEQCSIRNLFKNWADNVLFVGYDVFAQDGKGQGSGTRTIYTTEMPTHVAKTRVAHPSIAYNLNDPGAIWRALGVSAS